MASILPNTLPAPFSELLDLTENPIGPEKVNLILDVSLGSYTDQWENNGLEDRASAEKVQASKLKFNEGKHSVTQTPYIEDENVRIKTRPMTYSEQAETNGKALKPVNGGLPYLTDICPNDEAIIPSPESPLPKPAGINFLVHVPSSSIGSDVGGIEKFKEYELVISLVVQGDITHYSQGQVIPHLSGGLALMPENFSLQDLTKALFGEDQNTLSDNSQTILRKIGLNNKEEFTKEEVLKGLNKLQSIEDLNPLIRSHGEILTKVLSRDVVYSIAKEYAEEVLFANEKKAVNNGCLALETINTKDKDLPFEKIPKKATLAGIIEGYKGIDYCTVEYIGQNLQRAGLVGIFGSVFSNNFDSFDQSSAWEHEPGKFSYLPSPYEKTVNGYTLIKDDEKLINALREIALMANNPETNGVLAANLITLYKTAERELKRQDREGVIRSVIEAISN